MATKFVDGMPLKTVVAMLRSPNTPPWLKKAWEKKLAEKGYPTEVEKLEKLI